MMSDWASCSAWSCTGMNLRALLMHAEHLEAAHRSGAAYDQRAAYQTRRMILTRMYLTTGSVMISFAKIIACIRVAVPYTGMIISTRESTANAGKR